MLAVADLLLLVVIILLSLLIRETRSIRKMITLEQFPCFSEEALSARTRQRDKVFNDARSTEWTDAQWEASTKEQQAEMAAKRYVASALCQSESQVLSFMQRANFEVRVGRRSPEEIQSEQATRVERTFLDPLTISRHQDALRRAVLNDGPIPEPPRLGWDP